MYIYICIYQIVYYILLQYINNHITSHIPFGGGKNCPKIWLKNG